MQKSNRYCIFKLKFITPLRFGVNDGKVGLERSSYTCYADTLFSALCNEVLAIYGKNGLDEFVSNSNNGETLFSDMFPYHGEELYLPRPFIIFENKMIRERLDDNDAESFRKRKKFKKLSFVPVSKFKDFLIKLEQGEILNLQENEFGTETTIVRVNMRAGAENLPYAVSSFSFRKDSGLYFILGFTDEKYVSYIKGILKSLSLSGIGGKRSSGYGKFELYEDEIYVDAKAPLYESDRVLGELFENKTSSTFMNISILKPQEEEFKNYFNDSDSYSLVKRGGFIYSENYSNHFQKKESLIMFKSGSCFKYKFSGVIQDVSKDGAHPVLKYGKGLYIGI
jgi:CRISPR-associated protein Csm4